MHCQFCHYDPDLVMLVPARGKFGDAIEVIACRGCAIKNNLYCMKHETPLTGFVGDDSVACLHCIQGEVEEKRKAADGVYLQFSEGLPKVEWDRVLEDVEIASAISHDEDSVSLFRFVVTKAHRLKVPFEEVVSTMLKERSADLILSGTIFS